MKNLLLVIFLLIAGAWAQSGRYIAGGQVKIMDEGGEFLKIHDGAGVFIGYEHEITHEGMMYRACYFFPSIADNGLATVICSNGAGNYMHWLEAISMGGKGTASLYLNPLWTNNGTLVNPHNKILGLTNTNNILFCFNAVITNYGTYICPVYLPGGTKQAGVGADVRSGSEYILPSGMSFLIIFSNFSGGATEGTVNTEYYFRDL